MSETHNDSYGSYLRRCALIFGAVVCCTLMMVGASFAPLPNRAMLVGLVLAGAAVNAFLVSGYLMHLISEKRVIYALLAFTLFFFVGLMGLSIWAANDAPTIPHV